MGHISTGSQIIAVLNQGDDVVASITKIMAENYTRGAAVLFGIGSLAEVEFGTLPESGPHKHKKVKAWLKRHPRFKVHFTPTSSS